MKFEDIQVSAYSGYRHAERPVGFRRHGKDYAVVEILDRWYGGSREPGSPCLDYFRVRADDGGTYLLRYNGMFDAWALVVDD